MVEIKQERQEDRKEVYTVNKLAFNQEDEALLTDKLRKSHTFVPELSLVAWDNNAVIGYILFTKVFFEKAPQHKSLALAPLSVHPQHQRKGVGSLLMNEGINRARKLGYQSIIVLGHKDYYRRFGFQDASNWNIESPFGSNSQEFFKVIELVKGNLDTVCGQPIYAKEFLP
ncbi:acyl-CoA N-acyltransferase [Conidiobolus coronatus NRRL 28638]|uniref:Acyl-CoA N-acyltransferase n=1 Tax=Conidiobolus coronatus (strain ATCC 28846 / CBS 209.66 / NRRL 28638) TaxID=796925 RepID=A0A137P1D5_CONC2|nr:acyl-CoA N-acyltransferase [Conidiobolus coronatus NRRL 28638]|eukprot:KXN68681.1 acyl-CoA N-acyltransferase [Conidiobolus coronatus NRRL 28638]